MHPRKRILHLIRQSSGFGLMEVLVAAIILIGIIFGFMNFMKMANKGQANLAKVGEVAGIDMTFRTLLTNNKACVMNATHLTLGGAAVVGPVDAKLYDANDAVIFEKNKISNGIKFTEIKVTISAAERGVHSVRYDVKLEKAGVENLGKLAYDYVYFINVAMDAANLPTTCYQAPPGNPVYQMIGMEPATFSPAIGTYEIGCNGVISTAPLSLNTTCSDCVPDITNCRTYPGAASLTTVAQGNYLRILIRGAVGLITAGPHVVPASVPAHADHYVLDPGDNPAQVAVGTRSYLHLTGPGVDEKIGFGGYSRSTAYRGHTTGAAPYFAKLYPVTAGQTYTLQLVPVASTGSSTAKFISATTIPENGVIEHWNKIGNP